MTSWFLRKLLTETDRKLLSPADFELLSTYNIKQLKVKTKTPGIFIIAADEFDCFFSLTKTKVEKNRFLNCRYSW